MEQASLKKPTNEEVHRAMDPGIAAEYDPGTLEYRIEFSRTKSRLQDKSASKIARDARKARNIKKYIIQIQDDIYSLKNGIISFTNVRGKGSSRKGLPLTYKVA
jgi:hypothetical protein